MENDKRFEYLVENIKTSEFRDYFGPKGKEGWELCDTIPLWTKGEIICIFKKLKVENIDMGEISDGYHTFNELYEYRMLYNAALFNEWAKQDLYDVHKSKRHSDGKIPFENENWFIVQAELPTGQISNHYEMKYWDLFKVPEKTFANEYDGHTPKDVAKRLEEFLK